MCGLAVNGVSGFGGGGPVGGGRCGGRVDIRLGALDDEAAGVSEMNGLDLSLSGDVSAKVGAVELSASAGRGLREDTREWA